MQCALVRLLFVAQCLICWTMSADAHGYKHKTIEIIHPWTFDRPEPGGTDAIVSMDIKNSGKQPDRLIRATSTIAARVDIAQAPGEVVGTSKPAGVDVGAVAKVELSAKGPHLRLIGLKKALTAYDTLPVTLVFEKAGRIRIDVLVEEYSEPKN